MTQDAASRAAEKTLRLCEQRWGRAAPDSEPVLREEAAALVRAEYAELVRASFALLAELPLGLSQLATQRKESLLNALQDVAGVRGKLLACVEMTNSAGDIFTVRWEERDTLFDFLDVAELDETTNESASYSIKVVMRTQEQLDELDEDSGFQ